MCNNHGVHHGTAFRPEVCEPAVWTELGIPVADLPDILSETEAGLAKADAILAAAN